MLKEILKQIALCWKQMRLFHHTGQNFYYLFQREYVFTSQLLINDPYMDVFHCAFARTQL